MKITIELNEQQIKLLKTRGSWKIIFESISVYLQDYYRANQSTMNSKRKSNIEYMVNHSIPFMKDIDQIVDQIRDQIKLNEKEETAISKSEYINNEGT